MKAHSVSFDLVLIVSYIASFNEENVTLKHPSQPSVVVQTVLFD